MTGVVYSGYFPNSPKHPDSSSTVKALRQTHVDASGGGQLQLFVGGCRFPCPFRWVTVSPAVFVLPRSVVQ